MKPKEGSYPVYFSNYIHAVQQDDVLQALHKTWAEVYSTITSIPETKANFAYAEGKWTIKQVLNHIIDAERIFAYRALRFARKDAQQLSSFDENVYAQTAEVQSRTIEDLLFEFEMVRKSSICLFKSFSNQTLLLKGETAAGSVSVLALGFMISGHALHHLHILKERYLKAV